MIETFGQRLRAWRKRCHLSQSQAAAALFSALDTIQDWEKGRRRPIREPMVLAAMEVVERRIRAEDTHAVR